MKNAILFKTLIDILFVFHVLGLIFIIGVIIIIPFGTVTLDQVDLIFDKGNVFHWCILGGGLIVYIIFLRGLYFLRIVARSLLSKRHFTDTFIINIKKSGVHFLYTGLLYFILLFGIWLSNLFDGHFDFKYDTNFITPFFITIIGLFFIIQSRTIMLAKAYKEDNELTV